jgi:putative ABC transport system ATP-binding protein
VEEKMDKPLISLNGVHKSFMTDTGVLQVLQIIHINISKGDLVGVFGKSGSGKSTLLNMLTGIDRPTEGEIWINNQPIHQFSESEMALYRGNNIGIVFQFFQLLPMLTVLENVIMPMDFCKKYAKAERKERAMDLLKKLQIEDQAHKFPTAISGGQQQRTAIARALANNPDIIVADEPTGNLDSITSSVIFEIFKQQTYEGKTVIIVTHDNSLKSEFSTCFNMSDGKIVS